MAGHTLQGADGVAKALEEIAKRMGGGEVAVGFMEGATYPDGTPVAAVAFWNEFGTTGTPARPFFRQMIAAESPTWAGKMAKLAKATNYDGDKVLALMGEDVGGALRQSINDFQTPELAESTKAAKGFAKPLIDTSHMINSICYQVEDGAIIPIKKD
ncbi:MAG: hypothetical protein WC107_07625 [Patescibacteria group bacterium]|jgi:hypothetical protein